MAWKFVITSKGYLRMGDVKLRESYDYGRPQWSKLAAAGTRLRVPKEYEGFAFVWQEGNGHIQSVNLSDWLGIDWVTSPHE